MPVDWKQKEAFTRLLAAMVAAQDMKLDYKKIASMYGHGTTYDSIEGRFRIIKKDAAALKAEHDSGEGPEPSALNAVATNSTTKKSKSSAGTPVKARTIGGRVGKSNGTGTPSKKRGSVKGIKAEPGSSSSSFIEMAGVEDEEMAAAMGGFGHDGVEGDGLDLIYENDFVGDGMDLQGF